MTTVYSYIRFSSTKQIKGDSLRRQTELAKEFCKRNNHTLANLTLQDLGISAFKGMNRHKGALKTFLSAVEEGTIQKGSILLVENLDRLSREGIADAVSLFVQILNSEIKIAVLSPSEKLYSKANVNDIAGILEPLMSFHLANEESKKKSDRLSAAWNNKRKRAANGEKFNARCPSWLEFIDGSFKKREGWQAIPYMFQRSVDGIGQQQLLKELQKKYKPLGRSERWNSSFIQKVLSDRSVLGELQPMTVNERGERVPVGDVLTTYYPKVVSENLFYRSQVAKQSRQKQKGPNSKFINLFTGLIINENDGGTMHVQSSPSNKKGMNRVRRLVSYRHKCGEKEACPLTIEYDLLARAVLSYLSEINPAGLNTKGADQSVITAKEQERDGLLLRLKQLQASLEDPEIGNLPTIIKAVASTESKLQLLQSEIEALKQNLHKENPIIETQDLVAVISEAKGKEKQNKLLKLKSLIADLIESISIRPEKFKNRIVAIVQINFSDGGHKHIFIGDEIISGQSSQHLPTSPMPELDLRSPRSSHWSLIPILEEIHGRPETIPDTIPDNVRGAADMWLKIQRNEKSHENYRMIPSKIQRFVEFVGKQKITQALWDDWTLCLMDGDLARNTARVTYNRSKQFVDWLTENEKIKPFDRRSAAKAIPS